MKSRPKYKSLSPCIGVNLLEPWLFDSFIADSSVITSVQTIIKRKKASK